MENSVIQIMASASAGACVFCGLIGAYQILSAVKIDKKSEEKQLPLFLRIGFLFAPNLSFATDNQMLDPMRAHARELIQMSGYDQVIDAKRFIEARVVLSLFGLIFFALMLLLGQPALGILITLLLFIWPTIWIKGVISRRHNEIQKALPNVLDLLTLSVEAGKDFVTALRDILGRRKRDALTEELEIAFREIQLGKQRRVALRDMAARVRQHDLTAVVNAIAQADELGVSIGSLLRIQGDQLRAKRFQRAEKLANEAPVKILFPVVVFIFPSVFIILLGPILMQAFKTLFK